MEDYHGHENVVVRFAKLLVWIESIKASSFIYLFDEGRGAVENDFHRYGRD